MYNMFNCFSILLKVQNLRTKDLPTVFPAGDLPGRPSTPVW